MVSRPTLGVIPPRTACSATSRTVHRARPAGAGPHTIATIAARCALSRLGSGLPRGSSVSAAWSPRATYRFPTRDTSRGNVPTAFAVPRTDSP
jgi:hypothetical protein